MKRMLPIIISVFFLMLICRMDMSVVNAAQPSKTSGIITENETWGAALGKGRNIVLTGDLTIAQGVTVKAGTNSQKCDITIPSGCTLYVEGTFLFSRGNNNPCQVIVQSGGKIIINETGTFRLADYPNGPAPNGKAFLTLDNGAVFENYGEFRQRYPDVDDIIGSNFSGALGFSVANPHNLKHACYLEANGGSFDDAAETRLIWRTHDSSLNYADIGAVCTKYGYDHIGWSNVSDAKTASSGVFAANAVADHTITDSGKYRAYAVYKPSIYSITYHSNGGNDIISGSYTIESATFPLPVTKRTGYQFEGWYDNYDLTGNAITQIPSGSTGDLVLYAKWSPLPVIILTNELPNATCGEAYFQTLKPGGPGGSGSMNWSVDPGSLPAGLTCSSNGTISGTPLAASPSGITITVNLKNQYGATATKQLRLVINKGTGAVVAGFSVSPSDDYAADILEITKLVWKTNPGSQQAQYGYSTDLNASAPAAWSNEAIFSGLSPGKQYKFFVRAKENDNYKAGAVTGKNAETLVLIAAETIIVDVPVAGNPPATAISSGTGWSFHTISWSDEPLAFQYDTIYTARITLRANTGMTFNGHTGEWHIPGADKVSMEANTGKELTLSAVFPKTAPERITPTYMVTIPAGIQLTYGKTSASKAQMVKASSVQLNDDERVDISIYGGGDSGKFILTNETDKVPYQISKEQNPWNAVKPYEGIASFKSDGQQPLFFKVSDWNAVTTAGTYQDKLTFIINLVRE